MNAPPRVGADGALTWRERFELGALSVAAFVLRLALLERPLRYDESASYLRYARGTFWGAISTYNVPNNHLFQSLCMWLSTHVFGQSVVALRLPVFACGVALVPLTYLLAREVSGPIGALLAASLAAGCDLLVMYSVDARGYGMQAALFVAALVLVPRLVRLPSLKLASAFALTFALAMFTVPTLVYAALTPLAWGMMLARAEARSFGRSLRWLVFANVLAGLVAALLYTPAFLDFCHRGYTWHQWRGQAPLLVPYGRLFDYFVAAMPMPLALAVLAAVSAGVAFEAWSLRRLPLAAAWIGLPLGGSRFRWRSRRTHPIRGASSS